MGAKRVLEPLSIITNGVMTGTSVITSTAINIKQLDSIGLQISWTGTAIGSFQIQCSIDGTNYFPLSFSPSLTSPSGSADGFLINLAQLSFPFIRVVYTNSSSTGVLNASIVGKDWN